jgi:hypothetical protein
MKKKEQDIILDLVNLYRELYPHRKLFKGNHFKYSPEEIIEVISNMVGNNHIETKINKKPIRESIMALESEDDVRGFYQENLLYDYSDNNSREDKLRLFSTEELIHIYNLLYSTPSRSKARKVDLLNSIGKYFETIDRALRMKP